MEQAPATHAVNRKVYLLQLYKIWASMQAAKKKFSLKFINNPMICE